MVLTKSIETFQKQYQSQTSNEMSDHFSKSDGQICKTKTTLVVSSVPPKSMK